MSSKYYIEKSLIINASPKEVYTILIRFEYWNRWTKSISSISLLDHNKFKVGARIKVLQPKLPSAIWTIAEIIENQSLVWEKKSFGLKMIAQHSIIITNNDTLVTLRVVYEGFLAKLSYKLTSSLTDQYMTMEINGLKNESERS